MRAGNSNAAGAWGGAGRRGEGAFYLDSIDRRLREEMRSVPTIGMPERIAELAEAGLLREAWEMRKEYRRRMALVFHHDPEADGSGRAR